MSFSPRRLSPLQAKGFLTLSILIFAESITFCNAVSLENTLHNGERTHTNQDNDNNSGDTFSNSAHLATDHGAFSLLSARKSSLVRPIRTTTTTTTTSKKKKKKSLILSLHKRFPTTPLLDDDDDETRCHDECSECFNPLLRACYDSLRAIPRGGHNHHHHASTTTTTTDQLVGAMSQTTTTPYNIPLHAWKVIFQAFLTALNVLCWWLPLKSKKISENKLALSLANAFSGGVFLSLAFGHLIPECTHGFVEANVVWPEATPFLLVLLGYLLIFFVEKVAFDAHEIMHEMQGGHLHHHHHDAAAAAAAAPPKQQPQNGKHHHQDAATTTTATTTPAATPSSGRSAVILLGALAVHSILEMMALGLADSFGDCALLTLSISLHQPAESIALLVAFIKSGMTQGEIIRFLSIFSCMGPLGVALGMAVNEFAAPIVDSIMLAIVAGTFVYVGATEVIPEEWEDGASHKWAKFMALSTGIVSILVITQYTMSLGGH